MLPDGVLLCFFYHGHSGTKVIRDYSRLLYDSHQTGSSHNKFNSSVDIMLSPGVSMSSSPARIHRHLISDLFLGIQNHMWVSNWVHPMINMSLFSGKPCVQTNSLHFAKVLIVFFSVFGFLAFAQYFQRSRLVLKKQSFPSATISKFPTSSAPILNFVQFSNIFQ